MKILVVEDNAVTREMLRVMLHEQGYEVLLARDGQEALDLLKRTNIRLVLSDWDMPGVSGLELCRKIRSWSGHGYVFFILLTQHVKDEDVVLGLSAGADDFVRKPFDREELLMRIRVGERILGLESRQVTIFALAKLAESRDPETGAHLERVQSYSRLIAERLRKHVDFETEIDAGFCELVYLTSPLHDIGKVAIPDHILLKPGPLSDEEFAIMKTHTTIGAHTLDAALEAYPGADYLFVARDIAATHHERFDGSGYPEGLSGDEIPLAGRIVAVADVYDALRSKRVYKEPYDHAVSMGIIAEESGRQFDPRVVEAFIAEESEVIAIQEQYRDAPVEA